MKMGIIFQFFQYLTVVGAGTHHCVNLMPPAD